MRRFFKPITLLVTLTGAAFVSSAAPGKEPGVSPKRVSGSRVTSTHPPSSQAASSRVGSITILSSHSGIGSIQGNPVSGASLWWRPDQSRIRHQAYSGDPESSRVRHHRQAYSGDPESSRVRHHRQAYSGDPESSRVRYHRQAYSGDPESSRVRQHRKPGAHRSRARSARYV